MADKSIKTLEIRQFFSENEYLDMTELVKVSKKIVIFKQLKNREEQLFFIGTNRLKVLDEDLKRIDLEDAIDFYDRILFEGNIFDIEEVDSPSFKSKLVETFIENQ